MMRRHGRIMLTPDRLFIDRDSFEDEGFADLDLANADLSNKEFLRCTFTVSTSRNCGRRPRSSSKTATFSTRPSARRT
jgi:hypothetical protein